MKALIKFSLIKGKIKRGDWTGQTIKTYPTINFGIWRDDVSPKNTEYIKFKKAKPFMVALNIKVGDKVRGDWKGYENVAEIKNDEILLARFGTFNDFLDDEWHKLGELPIENFKILGEVSPEATFVEDGKEYKVMEWKTADEDTRTPNEMLDGMKKPFKKGIILYYKVKCPCCETLK
ncbi:hypothetical protein LCGC14_0716360 [marine sediment metagenome]|uniref:Uncharacterized protein n=1 Tax=marine sediment metagenome TaxID=412755 RepID=A0A0F9QYS7_9ZZZZ